MKSQRRPRCTPGDYFVSPPQTAADASEMRHGAAFRKQVFLAWPSAVQLAGAVCCCAIGVTPPAGCLPFQAADNCAEKLEYVGMRNDVRRP